MTEKKLTVQEYLYSASHTLSRGFIGCEGLRDSMQISLLCRIHFGDCFCPRLAAHQGCIAHRMNDNDTINRRPQVESWLHGNQWEFCH